MGLFVASIHSSPVYRTNAPVVTLFSQSKNAATARITSIWKTSVQGSHQIYKALAVILVRIYDAGCALSDSIKYMIAKIYYMIAKIYPYVLNALGLRNSRVVHQAEDLVQNPISQLGLETLRLVFSKYKVEYEQRVELTEFSRLTVTQAVKTDVVRWSNGSVQLNRDSLSTRDPALLLQKIRTTLAEYCHPMTDNAFDNLTNLLSQVTAGDICSKLFHESLADSQDNIGKLTIKSKMPLNGIIRTNTHGVRLHLSWDFIYTSCCVARQELGTRKVSRKFFIPWKDLKRNWSSTPLALIAPGTTVHDDFGPFLQS